MKRGGTSFITSTSRRRAKSERRIVLPISITDAIATGVAPLETKLSEQETQIAELQKALQDTVTALNNGDTATAQVTASAAASASLPANDPATQAVS